MRVAWFTPRPIEVTHTPSWDDTGLLIHELRARHDVELVDAGRAHDFVWRHARDPFDLCVYELGGTAAHQFAAAYAVHYPGVVLLRGLPRHDRALLAARVVVVPHEPVAQAIADDYPGARVRTIVPGVAPLEDPAEVVVALRWPPDGGALAYALAGFAAGRAVIVFDGPETADWPSLDPQTWEPRAPLERLPGGPRPEPICVSLDPRDEAHSLRLARKRLDADPGLRARLGAAAHEWWRAHATVGLASSAFDALLDEARAMADPPASRGADDGAALARRLLQESGVREQDAGLAQESDRQNAEVR